MCTDAELKTKAGNHDFEGDLYPERSTDSVQGYFNVYTGTIYSNFPYIDEEDG
jgi:phosphoenolpyruvate carboxylase